MLNRLNMPSMKELERWMGTGQVANRLGYSRQGVINLAEDRKIRAVKTGAGWLYDPDSVEEFAKRAGRT
jgi:excisionase family DNA binding protein